MPFPRTFMVILALTVCLAPPLGLSAPRDPEAEGMARYMRQSHAPPPRQPPAIVKLAEAYVALSSSTESEAVRNFVRNYIDGFMQPETTMSSSSKSAEAGFKAGQEARKTNPGQLDELLKSYGYVPMKAVGTWRRAMEISDFRPDGARSRESWWITCDWEVMKAISMEKEGEPVRVRIAGYLSPLGYYGHMGAGEYQFHATKIESAGAK